MYVIKYNKPNMNCFKKHYCPVCMEEKNCGIKCKICSNTKICTSYYKIMKKDKLINVQYVVKKIGRKNVLQKYFKNNEKL